MARLNLRQTNKSGFFVQRTSFLLFLILFGFSGCSIWNGYLDPNYESDRADRLCHPYGDCSQGIWRAADGSAQGLAAAKAQCVESVDRHYGNGWWSETVARGIEIGTCMESKGYTLQQ